MVVCFFVVYLACLVGRDCLANPIKIQREAFFFEIEKMSFLKIHFSHILAKVVFTIYKKTVFYIVF